MLHPVAYTQTAATLVGDSQWEAKVVVPTDGNWTAFFVDLQYEGGAHFTSQMSVVPVAYPYTTCKDDGPEACARLV
jgi:hypothetical protein